MKRQLNLRFLAYFAVVCLGIGGGAIYAHSFQTRRHADYLVKRGHEAEEKGELDKALDYYGKYLAFRPDDAAALGRFGSILASRAVTFKQKEVAFLTLERALREDPGLKDVRRRAADVAIELYRFSDARVNVAALLESSPNDPELMELLGRCEEEDGRIPEAVAQYEQVIAKMPDRVNAYSRLASLYTRTDKRAEADRTMANLIANNPESIRARLIRFQYFRGAGDLKAAREDLAAAQKAKDLGESEAEVLLASADLAIADRNYDEARKLLARGRVLPKQELRFSLGLANLELKRGSRADALKILREARDNKTANPSEVWAVADLLIDANEAVEAEQLLATLSGRVEQAPIDYLSARIKMQRGEISSAVSILERCRVEFVRMPDLALQTEMLLANCYERLGQTDQRLEACRKALQIDRTSVPARLALASTQLAMGKIDDAIREYQSMRERYAAARVEIARVRLWQAEQLPDRSEERKALLLSASAELDGTSDDLKRTPEYQMARVQHLIATGKRDEARKVVEAARDKNPEEVRYWQVLASLAAGGGTPADGLAILKAAAEKLGDKVDLKLSRIALLLRDKAAPAAFLAMEDGLDKLPESDQERLIVSLAEAHSRSKSPENAERLLRKLAGLRPNDLGVLSRLFDAVAPKGNVEEIGDLADRLRRAEGEDGVVWRFAEAYRIWLQYVKDKGAASLLIAKSRLEDAGKRRPGWYRVPLLEAEIEDSTGQIEAAIEKYKAAIRAGARYPEVVRRVVQLLVSRRRFDEAREQLNAARSQSSTLTPELGKAAVEIALRQEDSTVQAVESAEKLVPNDSKDYRDHLWRGMVYSSANRRSDAERSFRRAAELDAEAPETIISLVVFLARNDKVEDANREIEKAKTSLPPEKRARVLAPCYEAVGNKAEAEKNYLALDRESPNDPGVIRSLASFYLSTGDAEKAGPVFRRLIDLAPSDSDLRRWARRALAISLVGSGDYVRGGEALGLVDVNLREKPTSPEDLRARALVLAFRPGGRQESIKHLEDSFATILPSPAEDFMLARLYELDGNWLKAKERFESLLTKAGGRNPAYFAHYIRGLLKRDDVPGAAAWFNRLAAVEQNGQSPYVVEIQARLWVKQGKKSEAANLLKDYAGKIYQEKKAPLVLREVGRLLAELKLTVDAEAVLRQYVKEAEQKTPTAVLVLAEFLARDDRVGEAIRLCTRYLKTAGPELSALIATSAVRLGKASPADLVAAGAVVDEAMRMKPKSVDLQVSLAELRDAQGRYNEAIESYRTILARDPKNDTALNNLAWLLAFQDGKASEALEIIDRAIQAVGPEANLLDTRGVILLALNRKEEAIETLGKAVTQSRSPEAYFHLAFAHYKAGQSLEAQRTIRQAREFGFTKKSLHSLEIKGYDDFIKVVGEE